MKLNLLNKKNVNILVILSFLLLTLALLLQLFDQKLEKYYVYIIKFKKDFLKKTTAKTN
jgi:hypothetical protein